MPEVGDEHDRYRLGGFIEGLVLETLCGLRTRFVPELFGFRRKVRWQVCGDSRTHV